MFNESNQIKNLHFFTAVFWSLHSIACFQEVKESFRSNTWVGIASQSYNLPQQNSK